MTFRRLAIALAIGGLIAVLVLLYGKHRDEYEYPEEPEPLIPWWTTTSAIPMEDIYNWISG